MKAVQIFDSRSNEAINYAYYLLRDIPQRLLECGWFVGANPIWKNLHNYEDTGEGRSYRNMAHCAYPWHLADPSIEIPVIVIPIPETVETMVHEIGHVLDMHMGFSRSCKPCTWYAKTNRYEAFAEAFTAFYIPGYAEIAKDDYDYFNSIKLIK